MRIEWSPAARASARRYLADQAGAAVAAIGDDPLAAEGFHAGEYHRLRVGIYRVVYVVEADVITVSRVDRVSA